MIDRKTVWTTDQAHKHWGFEVSDTVKRQINQNPHKFSIVGAAPGVFGALVYRIICGTDTTYSWNNNISMSVEKDLNPLEWPRVTEGFLTYRLKDYRHFFEGHFSTVPVGIPLLEFNKDIRDLLPYMSNNKKLLIRSHRLDCHEYLNCKSIRVIGDLSKLFDEVENFYHRDYWNIKEVINGKNVLTISVENLLSNDFNTFEKEYLRLCNFLDVLPNTNNVRSFILLLLEKLKRFQLTLS